MDDRIAREGTLARCSLSPDEASADLECANARRAASAIALAEERRRRRELEVESERKLEALRRQIAQSEAAERAAAEAAAAAAEAAYEARWIDGSDTAPLEAPDAADLVGQSRAAPLSFIELPDWVRPIDPSDSDL